MAKLNSLNNKVAELFKQIVRSECDRHENANDIVMTILEDGKISEDEIVWARIIEGFAQIKAGNEMMSSMFRELRNSKNPADFTFRLNSLWRPYDREMRSRIVDGMQGNIPPLVRRPLVSERIARSSKEDRTPNYQPQKELSGKLGLYLAKSFVDKMSPDSLKERFKSRYRSLISEEWENSFDKNKLSIEVSGYLSSRRSTDSTYRRDYTIYLTDHKINRSIQIDIKININQDGEGSIEEEVY